MKRIPLKLVVALSLLLIPISYVIASTNRQTREAELAGLAQQRIEAAKIVFALHGEARRKLESDSVGQEVVYMWSRCRLDAEIDAATTREMRTKAYQEHLSRMQEQETYYRRLAKSDEALPYQVAAAELYRAEAEYWNVRETLR